MCPYSREEIYIYMEGESNCEIFIKGSAKIYINQYMFLYGCVSRVVLKFFFIFYQAPSF
jgi:hypothetical protein